MMAFSTTVVGSILVVVAVSAADIVAAAGAPNADATSARPATGIQIASGVISNLDVRERYFTLKMEERQTLLGYEADTNFLINGRNALEDMVMEEDMPVLVTFVDGEAVEIDARPDRQ